MPEVRIAQLESCHKEMFGDMIISCQTPMEGSLPTEAILSVPYVVKVKRQPMAKVIQSSRQNEKEKAKALLNELLAEINRSVYTSTTDYNSTSGKSHRSVWQDVGDLESKELEDLRLTAASLRCYVERIGNVLLRLLKRRDALLCQQDAFCDVITQRLIVSHRVPQQSGASQMRFSIQPAPGDTGFTQWVTAMKMVAQLPGGIPPEFRSRLWLQLAERHLQSCGVDWSEVERTCLTEWQNPGDGELGVQIVKDLHRTGCSLFCGEGGRHNQALLKRVLLAYARWNKAVGYCQGFNMLAALMLQVTDRCESDALKLMIYLIEGVLPDSYFADSLRGLSVDMAVFRELLRSRLPALSKHLDKLQTAAKDGGRCYEPPLTNVFTMQWFLTLFCNCLPHLTVLRVWDLILLEGNEILLRTALAIWQVLAEKIMTVRSADEFYCVMGVLTREILESGLIDSNSLIKAIVSFGPLTELKTLREHYTYNINPWGGSGLPHVVDKQVKVYPRPLALDITVLKKQYDRLRQRQREARVILGAVAGATSSIQPSPARPALNHLLVGRPALGPPAKDRPKAPGGSVPPPRVLEQRLVQRVGKRIPKGGTLHWKDAPQERRKGGGFVEAKKLEKGAKSPSSTSSSDTELCDESEPSSSDEEDNINNLPEDSNMVVTNDNIAPTVPDPVEANFIEPSVNVAVIEVEESNDPEFEQFLADRLKSLSTDEPKEEEKTSYSRRNSERAFQIMQENSMILHRILQCQTRMSPSPPSLGDLDLETNESDVKFENLETRSIEDIQSPVYGSQYTSILEKSKSLDEKYNTLILNQPSRDRDIPLQSSSLQEELYKKIYCDTVAESNEKGIEVDSLYLGCYNYSKGDNICTSDEQQSKDTLVINTAAQLELTHSLSSGNSPFSLSKTNLNSFNFVNVEANIITEKVRENQDIKSSGCDEVNIANEDSQNSLFATTPTNVPISDFVNVDTNSSAENGKRNMFSMTATNANLLDLGEIERSTSGESNKISSNMAETNSGNSHYYNSKANTSLDGTSSPRFPHSETILSESFGDYSKESLICGMNIGTDMLDYQKAEVRGEVKYFMDTTPEIPALNEKQIKEKSEHLLDGEIELHPSTLKNDTGNASQSTYEELNLSHNQYFPDSTYRDRSLKENLEQSSICNTPSVSTQHFVPDSITNFVELPDFTSNFDRAILHIDKSSIGIGEKTSLLFSDIQSEHNQNSNIKILEKTGGGKNVSPDPCNEKKRTNCNEIFSQSKTDLDGLNKDISELIQANKNVTVLSEAISATNDKSPSTHKVLFSLDSYDEEELTESNEKSSQSKADLDNLSKEISELIQANKGITILPKATSSAYEDKSASTHEVSCSNLTKLYELEHSIYLQGETVFKTDFEVPHLSEQLPSNASNASSTYGEESTLHQETDISKFCICSNKDQLPTDYQGEIVCSVGSVVSDQLDDKTTDRDSLVSPPHSPSTVFSSERLCGSGTNVYIPGKINPVTYISPCAVDDTFENSEHLPVEKSTKTESDAKRSQTTNFPRYEAYLKKIAATKSLKPDSCGIKSVEMSDIPNRSPLDENVEQTPIKARNIENVSSEYLRKLYSRSTDSKDGTSDKDSAVSLTLPTTDSVASHSDSSFSSLSRYTSDNLDSETQSQLK